MTALGGFVDLGQIVFTMQAGALFGYGLVWAIVLGTAGIMLYMEMCGRVAVVLHPNWHQFARGLIPIFAHTKQPLLYGYYAVGIFSALLMAYEVHFYSSGAIEEDWTTPNLTENFSVAAFGSALGAIITVGI